MTEHARLRRRAPTVPAVRLGEGPERVQLQAGEPFRVPPRKERDFAFDPPSE